MTSYALQINCISAKFPISTRLPSIFIPACSFPAATMAGVIGSEGLMEATSNAGVCPSNDPAANTMEHNKLFDTAVYLTCKKHCPISDSTIANELPS